MQRPCCDVVAGLIVNLLTLLAVVPMPILLFVPVVGLDVNPYVPIFQDWAFVLMANTVMPMIERKENLM